ncbi:MAG: ComEC/Rec2 family competence protein [Acidobacteria bacterium]|nr:ComEC/Rec2 family competence protein [Acidobacteriota bacterium]
MLKSSSANFTLYPLLWLAVCFAFGILTANFLAVGWQIYLIGCLVSAFLSVIFFNQKFGLVFLSLAFIAVGGLYLSIENNLVAPNRLKRLYDENQIKSGDPIEIEGVLQGKPELAVGGFFLILKTKKAIYQGTEIKISGNVRLFAPIRDEQIKSEYDQLNLKHGSRIRAACNLRREDNFLNAGVISHKELLDQEQIDAVGIIKSPLLVEKLYDTKTFPPLTWIYERRQNLIIDFWDNFNVSTAGVLIASLLGNQYFLDKNTAEIFREGGTFHVLVISGLHITFIGGLTLFFIQIFTNKRLWQFIIASLFLWSYSIAVGADVPVIRATIMFTILLFSQVIYRSGTLLNALGFCALILLIWRPNDIFTSSFQLTFVSVAAIVATAFPLIEKLRAIGTWSPSAEMPFPPNVSNWLRRFCETLYWRDRVWQIESKRNLWTAKLFKSPYIQWIEKRNLQNSVRYIFEGILVSTIMQIWLLPLLIIYFHRLSFSSIFLNLWVGITIGLESFAAVIAVFFAQISDTLALPFIKLTEFFNWLMLSVPQILSENDWASVRLPHYSGAMKAVYLLYFAPILFATVFLNWWKPFSLSPKSKVQNSKSFGLRVACSSFLIFLFLIIFHPFSAPTPDGRLHIDFLDVGQGDSALITFPNSETLLVDGGGKINFNKIYLQNEYEDEPELFEPDTQNIGERIVSAFLWEKGYDQIDYILATHADADHIQGLTEIARNFRVRGALFGRTPLKNAEFTKLYEILQKREVPIVKLSRGDVLRFDEAKIEVLYPEKDDSIDAISDNNNSVVLRLIYGERIFLLTGDIEKEAETELLQTPEFLQSDVVKAAHHGSRTSSTQEFIEATHAKLVIITVGRESPFGHPHKEVLERWKNSGAKIVTTGERGTVSISTDGKDLQLKTFLR